MGAKMTKIEPTGSDTYQVELSVNQTHIDRLIRAYNAECYKLSVTNEVFCYYFSISFRICHRIICLRWYRSYFFGFKADGMAIITSQIDKKEYRKLAIEDALKNISTNQNIRLNSFSLVENGKILVDQIQSSSSIEILSFEVIDEKIKSNIFHVTIEALIQDKKNC